ncbi:pilus assembly PilX family protein [Ectothiorhodospira variabilis]|uniref:pilus assembly PilX family protein n=1 Tax=Ectothiorhodospira variabilis TaxID=505694 RepID=UPI001EFA9E88|nr:PilX N-terminal domain-containing pilus assembly protein [Ectothiorhodospira variabilis]MCG5496888.1 PilX N-terminal domain-containing pilus assembly protein [Ectothiorhodospira variabilis]
MTYERKRVSLAGNPQGQTGAALIVALVMLLVTTMLAVAGVQNTVLQERMAGNMHDRNIAFQYAESGLRDAQRGLPGNANDPVTFSPGNAATWDDELTASTRSFAHHVERLEVSAADCPAGQVCPEDFGPVTTGDVYRITSKGVGGTEHAVVILQATIRSN